MTTKLTEPVWLFETKSHAQQGTIGGPARPRAVVGKTYISAYQKAMRLELRRFKRMHYGSPQSIEIILLGRFEVEA